MQAIEDEGGTMPDIMVEVASPWLGEQRGAFLQAPRAVAGSLGTPEDVTIVLVAVAADDVGLRGGQAARDVDVGYAIRI